jgi:hypothetical protein
MGYPGAGHPVNQPGFSFILDKRSCEKLFVSSPCRRTKSGGYVLYFTWRLTVFEPLWSSSAQEHRMNPHVFPAVSLILWRERVEGDISVAPVVTASIPHKSYEHLPTPLEGEKLQITRVHVRLKLEELASRVQERVDAPSLSLKLGPEESNLSKGRFTHLS